MNINNYRLTSLEEPPEEFLQQIMREAAHDAAIENQKAEKDFFDNIRNELSEIEKKWETMNTNLS